MKKVLVGLLTCIALVSAAFVYQKAKATDSTQDQYCASGPDSSYETLGNNGVAEQSFHPTQNRLSYVNLKIGGLNLTGNSPLKVSILTNADDTLIDSATTMPTVSTPEIRQWVFATPLTLDTSNVYKIRLEKVSGPAFVYWLYGQGDQSCDGDSRTYGFLGGTRQNWDFNFGTFGFTYTAPANENTNSSNSNTNSVTNSNTNSVTIPAGQSAGTGAAPSTTTSASIKAASGLTALYSTNAANLAWTASTTADIDGYKIFRSEAEKTGFTEIGKTVKATIQYVDTKDLTAGKTYYYFVRAYKTTAQSASTSTVSLLIPEVTATTNTNTNKTITPINASTSDDTDYELIQIYWISGWLIASLLVILIAYEIDQKRKGGFAGAKHFQLLK